MKVVSNIKELVDFLAEEIGIKPGDRIEIMTPQFERDWPLEIDFIPKDEAELKVLIESTPQKVLLRMGVCIWATFESEKEDRDKGESMVGEQYLKPGEIHYLLPGEWYDSIPEGFELIDIGGEKEIFQKGKTDNDIRFGCLAYGFIRNF